MALPPTMADGGPSPMAPGGAAPEAGAPLMDDTGEGDGGWTVCCTILKNDQGQFKLVQGEEPEPGEGGAEPEGQVFGSGPELLRGVMASIESDAGAEKSFGDAFAGKGNGGVPPVAGAV